MEVGPSANDDIVMCQQGGRGVSNQTPADSTAKKP